MMERMLNLFRDVPSEKVNEVLLRVDDILWRTMSIPSVNSLFSPWKSANNTRSSVLLANEELLRLVDIWCKLRFSLSRPSLRSGSNGVSCMMFVNCDSVSIRLLESIWKRPSSSQRPFCFTSAILYSYSLV